MQSLPTLAFAATLLVAGLGAMPAHAQTSPDTEISPEAQVSPQIAPITTCDTAGIGQAPLVSDLPTLPTTNCARRSGRCCVPTGP